MNIPNLMRRVADTTPEGGEWCTADKACTLASLVVGLRPSLVVEIGVWMGGSLVPMAMALAEVGTGKVIGVDPWHGGASAEGQTGANSNWWRQVDHEAAYRTFLTRLERHGLLDLVEVVRAKSDDVEPPRAIGLLHVDGNHSDQAVRDVKRYAYNVQVGGICVMDDIGWEGGGVQRAVDVLDNFGFQRLYNLDTGAVFQRVK